MFNFIARAKRYTKPLAVTAVVGTSALMLAAPPALAASQSQTDTRYRCQLLASEPKVSSDGHEITGVGSSMCMGTGWQDQQITVILEAQTFPTLFVVLASASTDYSSSASVKQTVSWPCNFSGTRTYTVETSWSGRDGDLHGFTSSRKSMSLTCSP